MTEREERQAHALFAAGQMMACELLKDHDFSKQVDWYELASNLDVEILEKFLEDPPGDFLYADCIKNTIKLVKEWRERQ